MPSVSKHQHNLMEMVKNNPDEAKKLGFNIPQKVAREFSSADKGRVKNLPSRAPIRKGSGRGR